MGLYYDELNIYGIKWDLIIETPVYKHTTIFGRSQINPLTEEVNEEIRAAFLRLFENEKEKYRFYFYRQGTSTYEGKGDTFYTWMPCSFYEVEAFLCKDMMQEAP